MTKKQVFKYICYAALLCSVPAGWATTVWADDAATPAQTPSSAPTLPTEYRTDFDVFDDQTMERSDWSNGSVFNCRWVPENTVVKDGFLTLTIDSNGNDGYNAGEWRTRQFFGYGRYEVRMKAIKNPGVVSSFFTYTGPSDNNPWDEVDIEVLGKDTTKVQFNYYTNGQGEHEHIYDLGFDAAEDFHTYAFDWQKDKIIWYVDGQEVYSATENIPVTPGKIMMNAWPGIGVDDWLQAYDGKVPLTATYDWMSYKATTDTDPADKPNEEPENPDNPADKPNNDPKDNDKPKPEDPSGNVPTDTEQPNNSPNLNKQAPEGTNSTPKTTNTAKVLPNQHTSNKLPATGDSKYPLLQIFGYVLFIGSILMMLLKPKKTSQND